MITPLPNPPLVTDSPTDFQNKASAFLGALPTFAIEANGDIAGITNTAATAMWVATTTYSRGNVVWSPATYLNYRLKSTSLTGAAGNADPSVDTTNWAQATGTGNVSAGASPSFTNLTATGNLSVGGNVSLGDAGTDTTTVASQLSANASVGTSGQVLTSRGANLSPQWTTPATIIQVTAVASTSGTSIDFLGIPAGVKRITVMLSGVSGSGSDNNWVRVGSGSFATSGYSGLNASKSGTVATSITNAFIVGSANAAGTTQFGHIVFTNLTGNTWVMTSLLFDVGATNGNYSGGSIALGGTLDRVQLLFSGSNTFDAGTVNILYV